MELPPLTKILPEGAGGGLEFASIVRRLFEAEQRETRTLFVQNFNDAAGDDGGADARLSIFNQDVVVQIKYYASPLSPGHKTAIKADFEKFVTANSQEVNWWLISPHDLLVKDLQWLNSFTSGRARHKGQAYLSNLFFKHPHIGQDIYRHHEFKRLAEEWRSPKNPEEFFHRFTDPALDLTTLFRNSLPSYYDCRQVFGAEWAEVMALYYQEQSSSIGNIEIRTPEWRQGCRVKYWEVNWAKYVESGHDHVPGGMKKLVGKIKPEVIFYSMKLIEDLPGNEHGYSLFGWTFINQRWVCFGKVHRAYRKVSSLRQSAAMKSVLRIAKCLGVQKYLKEIPASDFQLFIGLAADELLRDRRDGKPME